MVSHQPEDISIDAIDESIAGATHLRCIFRDGVKHRLAICRRTCDHPQDLACRLLLLQSLGKFSPQGLNGLRLFGLRLFRHGPARLRL